MKFHKKFLREFGVKGTVGDVHKATKGSDWYNEYAGAEVVANKLIKDKGLSSLYDLIIKFNGRYWVIDYSVGATEIQDEEPFEYEPDYVELTEVWPVSVNTVKYSTLKPTVEEAE